MKGTSEAHISFQKRVRTPFPTHLLTFERTSGCASLLLKNWGANSFPWTPSKEWIILVQRMDVGSGTSLILLFSIGHRIHAGIDIPIWAIKQDFCDTSCPHSIHLVSLVIELDPMRLGHKGFSRNNRTKGNSFVFYWLLLWPFWNREKWHEIQKVSTLFIYYNNLNQL